MIDAVFDLFFSSLCGTFTHFVMGGRSHRCRLLISADSHVFCTSFSSHCFGEVWETREMHAWSKINCNVFLYIY